MERRTKIIIGVIILVILIVLAYGSKSELNQGSFKNIFKSNVKMDGGKGFDAMDGGKGFGAMDGGKGRIR